MMHEINVCIKKDGSYGGPTDKYDSILGMLARQIHCYQECV